MPVFKKLETMSEPVLKPIKAVINWFKKFLKPVEDTGGAAENMGIKFGKAIANIILKFAGLISKVFNFGKKIVSMLADGILSGISKVKDSISKVTQIIRDYLPHSPAKAEPLKDLHKVKIVETIAATLKPLPLIRAMDKTMETFSGRISNTGKSKRGSSFSSPSFVVTYSPTITISGSDTKDEFLKMLKKHKDEVINIMKREFEHQLRVAY